LFWRVGTLGFIKEIGQKVSWETWEGWDVEGSGDLESWCGTTLVVDGGCVGWARVTRVCGRVGSDGCWSTGRIRGGLAGGGVGKQVDFVFSSWDGWSFWFWDSVVWRNRLLVLVFGTQELFGLHVREIKSDVWSGNFLSLIN
jgi:hypothetical protein